MDENRRMIIDPCDKNGEPLDIGMHVFTDDGHMSSIESFQWDGKEWCAVLEPFATYNPDGSVDTFYRGSYKASELTVKPKLVVEPENASDYAKGWKDGFDDGFASADDWYVEHEAELEKHGFMKLPRDADGEVIHVDDWISTGNGRHRVTSVTPDAVYWWEEDGCHWVHSNWVTRRCRQTVNDVLREFAHVGIRIGSKDGIKAGEFDFLPDEDAIAEFAKKLRLAGDE